VCQVTAQLVSEEGATVVDDDLCGTMYGNETVGFMLEWKFFGKTFSGFVSVDTSMPVYPAIYILH
jgi:hypothetical protein